MLAKLVLVSLMSVATLSAGPRQESERAQSGNVSATQTAARAAGPSIPITLVVKDSFGDPRLLGAVRRTVGAEGSNLIVIKRSALQPEFLVELTRAMRTSVAKHGAKPSKQVSMYFMKERRWRTPTATESVWARQTIAELAVAEEKPLGKLGVQRALERQLPQ